MNASLSLPSNSITCSEFVAEGFVNKEAVSLPVCYVSNHYGFSETGRDYLQNTILPMLKKFVCPLNPFTDSGVNLNMTKLNQLKENGTYKQVLNYYKEFDHKAGLANNKLMEISDCMISLLGHPADTGCAAELAYFDRFQRPTFALDTDFRTGDNIGVPDNLQLMPYINRAGIDGGFYTTIEDWYNAIGNWSQHKFTKI